MLAHDRQQGPGRRRHAGDLEEAIVEGAARADVMKRIAAPMVGGLGTSFALELLVDPALFAMWKGRGLPRGEEHP